MLVKEIESVLKSGDLNDFENLVNYYYRKIYGYINNMLNNSETARDLTQDVFVKVYQNIYKYNPEYPIAPWIYKIAHNITINYIRKYKRNIKEIELNKAKSDLIVYDTNLIESENRQIILKEIQAFKPDCRSILLLRFMDDLTFQQISEMLGISENAVKLKFYRSRKLLVEKLHKALLEK